MMKLIHSDYQSLVFIGLLVLCQGASRTCSFRPTIWNRVERPLMLSQAHYVRGGEGGGMIGRVPVGSTSGTALTTVSDPTDSEELTEMIPTETSLTGNPNIPTTLDVGALETDNLIITTTTGTAVTPRGGGQQLSSRGSWWSYIIPSKAMMPELVAESFGTFILLQSALGILFSAVIRKSMDGVFPIAALTAMAITVSASIVSSKCAAHFNPVITWTMCLYRNFGWSKFVPYVTAQMIGAALCAVVNYGLYAAHIAQYELQNNIARASMEGLATAKVLACYFSDPVTPAAAFLSEAFGTFVLASVVFALTSEKNQQVKGLYIPPIIGSTVALIIAVIGPISCASLNPARELAPRIVLWFAGWKAAAFHQSGLYLLAPMVGGTLGAMFVDKVVYAKTAEENNNDDGPLEVIRDTKKKLS